MIVLVCPGQGSQTPGFLTPWLELPGARELLASYSEAAGVDLIAHGTESDADTIRDTAIAQPLIVAASLLALNALREAAPDAVIGGVAGHSVGEIAAAAASGVLSETDALSFVAARARAMATAAAAVPTGMSAVLGGGDEVVEAAAAAVGLSPANYNGGGQIVVAGEFDGLEALSATPPAGARVIPLQVAGAFHTRYMESAREVLKDVAANVTPADPTLPLWTNNDGRQVASGQEFLDLLVTQVASPVRWDLCMESFAAAGITGLIELAPAGALVGLARRGLKGVPTVAIKSPSDIAAAVELLTAHAEGNAS
ncbi:ACP S-malonyltransferase [Mycetocola saprophilus]|uniref:ACP S-malonyltransferase n=1 Tax=Mycetocola saprophilus TaxID=76636 RepID=UPI0004C0756E|nr:ACP S-malonyltransferase [Mycetocola saprophilus]